MQIVHYESNMPLGFVYIERKSCHNFCFYVFQFKVGKESELDVWKQHIKAALQTDLSDEQSKLMRQKSFKISGHDDDEMEDGEELYECIDTMQQTGSASNAAEPDEGKFIK